MKKSDDELREAILEYLMRYEGVTGSAAVKAADDLLLRIGKMRKS